MYKRQLIRGVPTVNRSVRVHDTDVHQVSLSFFPRMTMPTSDEQRQPWTRFADAPVVQVVAVDPLPVKSNTPLEVTVVDLNMSFGSMVVFMVKWSLASIPAVLILAVPVVLLVVFLPVFLGQQVP